MVLPVPNEGLTHTAVRERGSAPASSPMKKAGNHVRCSPGRHDEPPLLHPPSRRLLGGSGREGLCCRIAARHRGGLLAVLTILGMFTAFAAVADSKPVVVGCAIVSVVVSVATAFQQLRRAGV